MPWKDTRIMTLERCHSERGQRFIKDCQRNDYTITALAERFSVSRTTA